MEKSLLIAVSDDVSHLYGVRFVSSFFRNKSAIKIMLFCVASGGVVPESVKGPVRRGSTVEVTEAYRKKVEKALNAAKDLLCSQGFDQDHVACKLMPKQLGTVKDIIREARKGNYDAVVLGRRGYMLFESILSSSVSKEIMDRNIDFPLWICRQPEEGRKNVLLCVDGSDPSLRMADHVGFMMKDEGDHRITILSVDTGEGADIQALLAEAKRKVEENGVPEERIDSLVVHTSRVVKAILEETDRKHYGVVAVGRAGLHKGLLKEWMVGSRSMKLLEDLDKAVLWVSK